MDYNDYFLIKDSCKVHIKNYASELRKQALRLGAGIYGKNAGDNIFRHLGDLYGQTQLLRVYEKLAPFVFNWRLLAVVTSTGFL